MTLVRRRLTNKPCRMQLQVSWSMCQCKHDMCTLGVKGDIMRLCSRAMILLWFVSHKQADRG